MFGALKALFEIGLSKNPIKVSWEKVDSRTRIGYFTVDQLDVHYITLSRVLVAETPLLSVSFGRFVNGRQEIALSKKNKDQFLVLGTVLRAIKQEVDQMAAEPVVVFTAKADSDSPSDFEKRKSVYRHIAQIQHKKMGGCFGDFTIDGGHLFYICSKSISRIEILSLLKSEDALSIETIADIFKRK